MCLVDGIGECELKIRHHTGSLQKPGAGYDLWAGQASTSYCADVQPGMKMVNRDTLANNQFIRIS